MPIGGGSDTNESNFPAERAVLVTPRGCPRILIFESRCEGPVENNEVCQKCAVFKKTQGAERQQG
jgi:hypothetical protein